MSDPSDGRPDADHSIARIFVQIPSYRDRECQWTVKDLFAKARHPERVFVGICWQFDARTDRDCFVWQTDTDHVRRVDFDISETQGLGWARAQAQTLWRGEEFTLQIDSHMRFVPDWDVQMLDELAACPSLWPVLTIYPAAYWPPDALEETSPQARMVQGLLDFPRAGILRFTTHMLPDQVPHGEAMPAAGIAGGFIFTAARMITDVPPDPELYFEGEEPNLAVRLWTSGFDIFSPRIPLIYHYYRRTDSRRPWDDANPRAADARSVRRLQQLTAPRPGDAAALGRHGLGKVRSLAEYEAFAGVDFYGCTIASYAFLYPFVYSDEMAETLVASYDLTPSPETSLFILDDAGVLFTASKTSFIRLTPTATYIWCAIEAGVPQAEIVAGLALRAGLALHAARRQFLIQVCHWHSTGALPGPTPGPTRAATPPPPRERRRAFPPADVVPVALTFRVLSKRLRVLCFGADYARIAREVLTFLPIDDSEGAAGADDSGGPCIRMFGIGPHHYVIRDDLFPPARCEDATLIASKLLYEVDQLWHEAPEALLQIRAGVIDDGTGFALVLAKAELLPAIIGALRAPGPHSGDGPAARVALALPVVKGGMRLILDAADGSLHAVQMPVVISHDSLDTWRERLALSADIPSHGGYSSGTVRIVPYTTAPAPGGVHVRRVFVVTSPDSETLSAADALAALIQAARPDPPIASVAAAAAIVEWIGALPCVRVTGVTETEAIGALREAVVAA